jgi:hypothetical protein
MDENEIPRPRRTEIAKALGIGRAVLARAPRASTAVYTALARIRFRDLERLRRDGCHMRHRDLWLHGAIRKTIFQKLYDEITQQTISNWIMQRVKTSRVKTTFRRVAVRHFRRHLDAVFRHYAFRRAEGKPGEHHA